ncbi:Arc family DNA-binding protein [Paenibacillus larvae]
MTNIRRLTLRVTEEMKEQLIQEAEKVGMSVNSLIIMKILNSQKNELKNKRGAAE